MVRMHSNSTSKKVVVLLSALGFVLALVVLRYRNLYEDEWFTLSAVQRPLHELWDWANAHDMHPPGSYALDRFLLLMMAGSARRLAAIHLLIWSAGSLFFALSARRLLSSPWGRAGFAAVAFMHPLVLMRVSGIRWYPIWWGLALALVAAGLVVRWRNELPSWGMTLAMGLAGGVLVYLDYTAVVFMACFGAAWLVRYRPLRDAAGRLLALAGACALSASPQLVELMRGGFHRGHENVGPVVTAALRLPYGLLIGEALLPWSPVGVTVALGLVIPCAWLIVRGLPARVKELGHEDPAGARGLVALLTFLVLFAAVGIGLGVGNRPYCFVGLVPVVSLFLALGAERVDAPAWRGWATALGVLWIATGAHNLIARQGTAKRLFNDHPEEIIGRLQQLSAGEPALVVTDDLVLTFEINERRAKGRTQLVTCSPFHDRFHGYRAGLHEDVARFTWAFIIDHPEDAPPGEDWPRAEAAAALSKGRQLIADPRQVDLGVDPDWRLKSHLVNARVGPSRLRAFYGRPMPGDWPDVGRHMELAAGYSMFKDL